MTMYETLEGLGPSAPLVASALRRLGVRGRPWCSQACPLARLLLAQAPPGTRSVTVSPGWALRLGWHGTEEYCVVPPGCVQFLVEFDDCMYPDLMEAEADESEDR